MGEVWVARHAETGVRYAVKTILGARLDSDRAVARFRREAEVLAGLPPHRSIVRVHAVGVAEGVPWCAMDLVEGRPLADLLRDGPLPLQRAVAIVVEVARAVEVVHGHDVVHRDLKPDNVLIDEAGVARVVDFGLAYDAFAETLTRTGECLGTPAFMAPEQVQHRTGVATIGPATDVYGLGAVLYAALTARPPFEGASALAVVAKVVRNDAPPPSRARPDAPPALDAICLRALEKEPARRFPSAAAFADDLERWSRGESTETVVRGRAGRIWLRLRPRTRASRVAASLLIGALAVASIAAGIVLGGAALAASPLERLARLEGRIDRDGRIDDELGATIDALVASIGETDEPGLAPRLELLRLLAAVSGTPAEVAIDDATAGALVAAVRPGGRLDSVLALRAQRALHAAGRLGECNLVVHGEPPAPPSFEVAADLARAIASGGPRLDPPGDPDAFAALLRAPGLDDATRGTLLLRYAEHAIHRGPEAYPVALDAIATALADHGVSADLRGWPPSFLDHAIDGLGVALDRRDERRADAIARALIRARDDGVVLEMSQVVRIQTLGPQTEILGGASAVSTRRAEQMLIVGPLLSRFGVWQVLVRKGVGLVESLGVREIVRRGEVEAERPPQRRNPALLLFIGELLQGVDLRSTIRFAEAAAASGVESPWVDALVGFALDEHDHRGRGLEFLHRAWEKGVAAGGRGRIWPLVPEQISEMNLDLGRSDPGRVAEAMLFALRAHQTLQAWDPWLDELAGSGARPPWMIRRDGQIAKAVMAAAEASIALGVPGCCDGTSADAEATAGRLLEVGLELIDRPMAKIARTLPEIDADGAEPSKLHGLRARHRLAHGEAAKALVSIDRAIDIEERRARTPSARNERLRRRWLAGFEDERAKILDALERPDDAATARGAAEAHREAAGAPR